MSCRQRFTAVAVFCVLSIPQAVAQKAAPPVTDSASAPASTTPTTITRPWPVVLPRDAPADYKEAATPTWSPEQVHLARARCQALLKGLDVVAVPETPMREGPECGTPAPMRLLSVGKSPQIALSPPPTLTCDMVAALAKWLDRDVQPLARKHLGAALVRIETMSSYSCRNAYGRAHGRLSEHGRANAVDIGAFITARGQSALVVADWGMTAREIAARAAAAKTQQAQTVKEQQPAAAVAATPPQAPHPVQAGVNVLRPGFSIGIPGLTVDTPGSRGAPSQYGLVEHPSRLGGPKRAADLAVPASIPIGGKMDFLRAAHRAACKVFGTVLGPEANTAHRNHFHLDMAERAKATVICE